MESMSWIRTDLLPPFTDSGMSSIVDLLPLLPLAIKNEHVVSAERYISGKLAPLFALLSLVDVLTLTCR